MGEPAFFITSDDISNPTWARKAARSHGGRPSLAEQLGRGLSRDPADGERYSFPDDNFLLMIGNTKELEDACRDAYDAGIRRIETQGRRELELRYVRMEVSWLSGQIDTLIAFGAKGRLPDSSADGWREHEGPWGGDYGLTADDHTHAHSLRPVIRGIKEFFKEEWHTAPLGPVLKV
jgi:hypothetical protein